MKYQLKDTSLPHQDTYLHHQNINQPPSSSERLQLPERYSYLQNKSQLRSVIIVVNPEIKRGAAVAGQIRDSYTRSGAIGQGDSFAERPTVYIGRGTVLEVGDPAIAGTVIVVAVEVLETEGVRVIRYQFVVCGVVAQVQTGNLRGRERGAVAAVLELVVIDVIKQLDPSLRLSTFDLKFALAISAVIG